MKRIGLPVWEFRLLSDLKVQYRALFYQLVVVIIYGHTHDVVWFHARIAGLILAGALALHVWSHHVQEA